MNLKRARWWTKLIQNSCQPFKPLNSVISCCLVYSSSTCCIYKPYFDIVLIFSHFSLITDQTVLVFHRSLFQPLDFTVSSQTVCWQGHIISLLAPWFRLGQVSSCLPGQTLLQRDFWTTTKHWIMQSQEGFVTDYLANSSISNIANTGFRINAFILIFKHFIKTHQFSYQLLIRSTLYPDVH